MEKIFTVAVVGPTATGKTDLGIEICKEFSGEIISADSMQIYKGISIASAAPSVKQRTAVPHHLVEFLNLNENFSVADYVSYAHKEIKEVSGRGRLPVIVGGTMLYIDSLLNNITFDGLAYSEEIREKLERQFDALGGEKMLKILAETDAQAAKNLHPNNRRRIIRALELYEITGKNKTEHDKMSRQTPTPYKTVYIGLNCESRQNLYDRINLRVDRMIENGLIKEAETTRHLNSGRGAAQAIGHKEIYPYLDGEISKEEAVENLKRATRRYAKRQLTWFNKNENINWIYIDKEKDVFKKARKIIEESICEEA